MKLRCILTFAVISLFISAISFAQTCTLVTRDNGRKYVQISLDPMQQYYVRQWQQLPSNRGKPISVLITAQQRQDLEKLLKRDIPMRYQISATAQDIKNGYVEVPVRSIDW